MNSIQLISFVLPRKERPASHQLVKHTANTPYIHFVGIFAIREQALGRTVPARRNVLSKGSLFVDGIAGAEIS